MIDFTGRAALVTGARSGLGRPHALKPVGLSGQHPRRQHRHKLRKACTAHRDVLHHFSMRRGRVAGKHGLGNQEMALRRSLHLPWPLE